MQHAYVSVSMHGYGEILHRCIQLLYFHVRTQKFVGFVFVRNTPLRRLFVDDESPLVFVWNRENRVAACRDGFSSDGQVCVGDECSRFICAGAPDLSVRHQTTKNLAALHPWARVVALNGLTVGEFALCGGWRAGALALILLGESECGQCEHTNREKCSLSFHDSPRKNVRRIHRWRDRNPAYYAPADVKATILVCLYSMKSEKNWNTTKP